MTMKPRGLGGGFIEENLNLSSRSSYLNDKRNEFFKEKSKRGFGVFKTKSKSKTAFGTGASYDQCFSGSNFQSQYEDECPVNYSLKYSETESCKGIKKKFKDYSDYAETDLDQPTDFSLKYAEKTYEDENKTPAFADFNDHKVKLKEFADYVETDLDQPTDFTLKYRESAEEEVKNLEFGYFENEERKTSTDDAPPERLPERYASQNETPLMFSRSSSMNSLSSFVHITQSIPDDRSSVVSDFSRMTSGIISPSELPDSPSQTAPSSPKRQKPPKNDFPRKQSVFEDDVATYKQEDTPIEFSRATSLSSLNIDNPVKPESVMKRNTMPLVPCKKENQASLDIQPDHSKGGEKIDHEKEKFELTSVLEVDESLFADCIGMDIQINCRKPKPNYNRLIVSQENNTHLRQTNGFPVKPNLRLRLHNENRKNYSTYEGSDDAVHTYHTEGTPANVSHAGSHSDLSALSIASGIALSGVEDNSGDECLSPEDTETVPKTDALQSTVKAFAGSESVGINLISKTSNLDVYAKAQPPLDYLRKDHQLTAKDETATFATENSPCDISIRSSLSDLTVNVIDAPLTINRTEGPPSQMLSPLRNVSPQSPNSIGFEEIEDSEKCLEEEQSEFISGEPEEEKDAWDPSNRPEKVDEKPEANASRPMDFDQPLTPFEEALVEECIRLGMHQKKSEQTQETQFESTDEKTEQDELAFSKSDLKDKKTPADARVLGSNTPNPEGFDFDSSEPLTPFEEVLLEQCIRLGMPQRKSSQKIEETHLSCLDSGTENTECETTELITPLETALLEQCIRIGMSQRKNQKKMEGGGSVATPEETHKSISYLTGHLKKLRLNSDNEREKKNDSCQCGKKHSNKKKNASCKKAKTRSVHFKVESCPFEESPRRL